MPIAIDIHHVPVASSPCRLTPHQPIRLTIHVSSGHCQRRVHSPYGFAALRPCDMMHEPVVAHHAKTSHGPTFCLLDCQMTESSIRDSSAEEGCAPSSPGESIGSYRGSIQIPTGAAAFVPSQQQQHRPLPPRNVPVPIRSCFRS